MCRPPQSDPLLHHEQQDLCPRLEFVEPEPPVSGWGADGLRDLDCRQTWRSKPLEQPGNAVAVDTPGHRIYMAWWYLEYGHMCPECSHLTDSVEGGGKCGRILEMGESITDFIHHEAPHACAEPYAIPSIGINGAVSPLLWYPQCCDDGAKAFRAKSDYTGRRLL